MKKPMKGRQKALFCFLFLFFLAFSQLNISHQFKLTNFPFSLSKVWSLLCHYFNNWGETVNRLVFLSVSTIWTVKFAQKLGILKFLFLICFVIIFYSLYFHPLPSRPLFLIVLHNGVKSIHVRKAWIVVCIGMGNIRKPLYWG